MTQTGKVSNRQIRMAVNRQADTITETVVPTLRALANDMGLNRKRLDALEAWRDSTFWQRVRWLCRGYR